MMMLKLKALEPKESEIKKSIRRYLGFRGIFHWNQWQGQFSVKGVPDIVGLIPPNGRLLAIEIKNPSGKIRPEQEDFLKTINSQGGLGFVARSVQDVAEKLGDRRME